MCGSSTIAACSGGMAPALPRPQQHPRSLCRLRWRRSSSPGRAVDMSTSDAVVERMEWLVAALNRYGRLYHEQNVSEIPDQEYDRLYRELEALEQTYPTLRRDDSPTMRVGGAPLEGLEPFVHEVPMLSLQNAFSSQELEEFEEKIRRYLGGGPEAIAYRVEPKLDGLAMELVYEDGVFVAGGTRGEDRG